jgi:hypothetical protein
MTRARAAEQWFAHRNLSTEQQQVARLASAFMARCQHVMIRNIRDDRKPLPAASTCSCISHASSIAQSRRAEIRWLGRGWEISATGRAAWITSAEGARAIEWCIKQTRCSNGEAPRRWDATHLRVVRLIEAAAKALISCVEPNVELPATATPTHGHRQANGGTVLNGASEDASVRARRCVMGRRGFVC